MTITSLQSIKTSAHAAAARGTPAEEACPWPEGSEHREVWMREYAAAAQESEAHAG